MDPWRTHAAALTPTCCTCRLRDERERRVGEEQQLLAEAVLREHNEAAAALSAELARLRLSYGAAVPATAVAAAGAAEGRGGAAAGAEDGSGGDVGVVGGDARAAEAAAWLRRCEWREARLALAARRRLMWQVWLRLRVLHVTSSYASSGSGAQARSHVVLQFATDLSNDA